MKCVCICHNDKFLNSFVKKKKGLVHTWKCCDEMRGTFKGLDRRTKDTKRLLQFLSNQIC